MLESMKMEYPLKAQARARVERVGFAAGSRVARGDVLFELAPIKEEPRTHRDRLRCASMACPSR